MTDQFLSGPLRLVVGGAAVRPSPQEADHDDASDSRPARSLHDRPRAVDVDALKALVADLPVDPGAVGDDLAAGERLCQRIHVVDVDTGPARDQDRLVGVQPLREVTSDEPGTACDGYSHDCAPSLISNEAKLYLAIVLYCNHDRCRHRDLRRAGPPHPAADPAGPQGRRTGR